MDGRPFFSQSASWRTTSTIHEPIFRRTFASGRNASYIATRLSARRSVVAVIGINTAVFAAWQYAALSKDAKVTRLLNENATLSLNNIREGRYHTLLTSAFSHMEPLHFLFNMFTLNAFCSVMSFVPGVGGVHIISLVVGSGLAGSLGWLYQQSGRWTRQQQAGSRGGVDSSALYHRAVGASGAVMGAGAVATCLMPLAPMNLMFIPIAIPLFVVTGAYFAIDAYYLDSRGRIGHAAHLGGSVYGVVFYLLFLRKFGGIWQMARSGLRR